MYFFEVGLNWQLCISMSSVIPSQFVGRIQLLTSCFVCNIPECSFFFFFSRVHSDHNDDGRVGSTCCHDSYSGGMLEYPQCAKVQLFTEYVFTNIYLFFF